MGCTAGLGERQRRGAPRALWLGALAGFAALVTLVALGRPAGAVSIGGALCPIGGATNSLDARDSLIDLGHSTVGVELAPEGGATTPVAVVSPWVDMADLSLRFGLDVDGDGTPDLDGRLRVRFFVAFRFGAGGITWQHWAVRHMRNQGWHIPDVLASEYGRSYPGNPVLAGLMDWFSKYFLELTLTRSSAPTAAEVPRGRLTLAFRLARVLGGTREYSFSVDTSAAGGPPGEPTPWPARTQVGVFVDLAPVTSLVSDWHFLTAVGLRTADAAGTEIPWDGIGVGVRVADLKEISVSYENPGAPGAKVGFPGDMAVALEHTCSPATGLGADLVVSHQPPPGGATPARAVARLETVDTGGERAMYLRAGLADPARVVGVRLTQTGAAGDVNGDGYTDFATDRLLARRSPDAPTRLTAVLESLDQTGDPSADVYMALDATLSPRLTADLTGTPVPGPGGTVTKDMAVTEIRACDDEWLSPACSASLDSVADARVNLSNVVPPDVGEPPLVFPELSPLPVELGRPLPDRHVRADFDGPAGTFGVGADLAGVRRVRVDMTGGDLGVTAATNGDDDPVGIEAHRVSDDGTSTLTEQGVLERLPEDLTATVDPQDVLGDGDPIGVSWVLSEAVDAHTAVEHAAIGPDARLTHALAHTTLPESSRLSLALDAATDPHRASWTASGATPVDVGITTRAATAGSPTFWLHADAVFPPAFAATWTDSGDHAGFDACNPVPTCGDLDLDAVLGETLVRDSGYWAVAEGFHGFGLAPAELVVTSASHFTPASSDFVDVEGDLPGREWEAGAALTGIQQVSYDQNAAGDTSVALRNAHTGPVGFEASVLTASAALEVWGVLAARPVTATVSWNAVGAPTWLEWALSSGSGAAVAAHTLTPDPDLGLRRTSLAAWLGTGTGLSDGIPATARLDTGMAGRSLRWRAGSPAKVDLGASTDGRNFSGDPTVIWAHLRGDVPSFVDADWAEPPTTEFSATTCEGGECDPAAVEVEGGMDHGREVGLWPVTDTFESLGPLPGVLAATAGSHFLPAPSQFARVQGDLVHDPWWAAGKLAALEEISFRSDPATASYTVDVGTPGGGQLGLDADVTFPGDTSRHVEAWGALASLPSRVSVRHAGAEGETQWRADTATPVGFAATYTAAGAGVDTVATAAGWLDPLPGNGVGAAGPATSVAVAESVPGERVLTWESPASTPVDAGFSVRSAPAPVAWGHVRATLGVRATASVRADRTTFTTCEAGACDPVRPLRFRGGVDRTKTTGHWPLFSAFTDFATPAPPAEITATAADHFPVAADEFAKLDGSVPDGIWVAELHVSHLARAAVAETEGVESGKHERATAVLVERSPPPGGDPPHFGISVDHADAGTTDPRRHLTAWGVLARLPESLDVDIVRTEQVGGDRVDANLETGGERTGAALALTHRVTGDEPYAHTLAAALWLGTGDGAEDGLPAAAGLRLDPAAGDDTPLVEWQADTSTRADVGVSFQDGEMETDERLLWARLKATVPTHIRLFPRLGPDESLRGSRLVMCSELEMLAGCEGFEAEATIAHEGEGTAGHAGAGYWPLTEPLAPARAGYPSELDYTQPAHYVRVDADVDAAAERRDVRADMRTPAVEELAATFDLPDASRRIGLTGRALAPEGGGARLLLDATANYAAADGAHGDVDARVVFDDLPERVSVELTPPGGDSNPNVVTDVAWDDSGPAPVGVAVRGSFDANPTGGSDPARAVHGALVAHATVPTGATLRAHRGPTPLPTPGQALLLDWNAEASTPLDAAASWATDTDLTGTARVHGAHVVTVVPSVLRLLAVERPESGYLAGRTLGVAACTPALPVDLAVATGALGVSEAACGTLGVAGVYRTKAAVDGAASVGFWARDETPDAPGVAPDPLVSTQTGHMALPAPGSTDSVVARQSETQLLPTATRTEDDRLAKYSMTLSDLRHASYETTRDTSAGYPKDTRRSRLSTRTLIRPVVLDHTRTVRAPLGDTLRSDRAYGALADLPSDAEVTSETTERAGTGELDGRFTWDLDSRPVAGIAYDRTVDRLAVVANGLSEHTGYRMLRQAAGWVGTDTGPGMPSEGSLDATFTGNPATDATGRLTLTTPGQETALDAALATADWMPPAHSGSPWKTHARVQGTVPQRLEAFWRLSAAGDVRADLASCTSPAPETCPDEEQVRDVKIAVVHEPVPSWPTPPLSAPLGSFPYLADAVPADQDSLPAFGDPDWDGADFARYVRRQTPPYSSDPTAVRMEASGKLARLVSASFGRQRRSVSEVPLGTFDVCAAGSLAGNRLALRVYTEDQPEVSTGWGGFGLTYLNADVVRSVGGGPDALPFAVAAELNLPHLDDSAAPRGQWDLGADDAAALSGTPLAFFAQRPCDTAALTDHATDPVPVVDPSLVPPDAWHLVLIGMLRTGTPGGIDAVRDEARLDFDTPYFDTSDRSRLPALPLGESDPGLVDVGLLTEDYTYGVPGATARRGLQAALNWRVARAAVVGQPVVARCGVGSQEATAGPGVYDPVCTVARPAYDAEDRHHVAVHLRAVPPAGDALAKLSVTLVGDDLAATGTRSDGKYVTQHLYANAVPASFDLTADVVLRQRDGRAVVDARLDETAPSDGSLDKVVYRAWNDYGQLVGNARRQVVQLVPPPIRSTSSLPTPGDPNRWDVPTTLLVFDHVPGSLRARFDAWLGDGELREDRKFRDDRCFGSGPNFNIDWKTKGDTLRAVTQTSDSSTIAYATKTTGPLEDDTDFDALADEVDTWTPDAASRRPRSERELRSPYVHGRLDLGGLASGVQVDLGTYGTRLYGRAEGAPFERAFPEATGDDVTAARVRATVLGVVPAGVTGTLRALLPGMLLDQHEDVVKAGLRVFGIDACVDMDFPLELNLSGASSLDFVQSGANLRLGASPSGAASVHFREWFYSGAHAPDALADVATAGAYHWVHYVRMTVPRTLLDVGGILGDYMTWLHSLPGDPAGLAYGMASNAMIRNTYFLQRLDTFAPVEHVDGATVTETSIVADVVSETLSWMFFGARVYRAEDAGETSSSVIASNADLTLNPVLPGVLVPSLPGLVGNFWRYIWGKALAPAGDYGSSGPGAVEVSTGSGTLSGGSFETFIADKGGNAPDTNDAVGTDELVGTLSDGTRVNLRAVFDREGHVELWLVGEVDSSGGPPVARFAKKIMSGKKCFGTEAQDVVQLRFAYDASLGSDGTFRVSGVTGSWRSGAGPDASDWKDLTGLQRSLKSASVLTTGTLVSDASGNMGWQATTGHAGISGGPVTPGGEVSVSVPATPATSGGCYILPGDGRRIQTGGAESRAVTYTHPGSYRVLVVCYGPKAARAGLVWDAGTVWVMGGG